MNKKKLIRWMEKRIPNPITNENLPVFHAVCEEIQRVETGAPTESAKDLAEKGPQGIGKQGASKDRRKGNHPIVKKLSASVRALFQKRI